ncbi:MAG: Spy/CpxP family protein refolding chaperone [Acidobacteriota bacterium]
MKKVFIATLLALFLFGASTQAADNDAKAQPPRRMPGRDFIASLNLTDAQKKDIAKIRSETQKRGVDLKAKAEKARIELRELLMAETPDQSAIEKKLNEVAENEADIRMNRIDGWFETNKLLTPDQQKQWVKALRFETAREMRQGRGAGMGARMRRPMGPMHAPAAPPAVQ